MRAALIKEEDKNITKKAQSPQEALRELVAIYNPESAVSSHDDMERLLKTKIFTHKNPLHALREIEVVAGRLDDKKLSV